MYSCKPCLHQLRAKAIDLALQEYTLVSTWRFAAEQDGHTQVWSGHFIERSRSTLLQAESGLKRKFVRFWQFSPQEFVEVIRSSHGPEAMTA